MILLKQSYFALCPRKVLPNTAIEKISFADLFPSSFVQKQRGVFKMHIRPIDLIPMQIIHFLLQKYKVSGDGA